MTIRIVTDSTCDLTPEELTQYKIGVIPCYINIGKQSFLDGKEITRKEFYNNLPTYTQVPGTSAPGIGLFIKEYKKLAAEGATHIISMHIHSGLSNLANVARMAAQAVAPLRVTIIETGQVAMGLGFMVLKAARAAINGLNVERIKKLIEDQELRTYIYAALDTVDYLEKSGRVPSVMTAIANLLRIKPIVQLHKGVIRLAGQVRTSTQGYSWLLKNLEKFGPYENLAILHTNAETRAQKLLCDITNKFGMNIHLSISEASPVLGVHVGPGGIGLACVRSKIAKSQM